MFVVGTHILTWFDHGPKPSVVVDVCWYCLCLMWVPGECLNKDCSVSVLVGQAERGNREALL